MMPFQPPFWPCTVPRLIVPAMNSHMWENPAVQRNLRLLKEGGDRIMEPAVGRLAEGYAGKGRMPEAKRSWPGLMTSLTCQPKASESSSLRGATWKLLTRVRFIGNRSSGKMASTWQRPRPKEGPRWT